jgi:gamma-glutamyltranspeptidase / glutathione hydrolase
VFATRPELVGTFGMVASTHWLASASGMAVLEAGGNAFDAAVATGLVLHVVEPHLNGLGGDAPILGFAAGEDAPFVICGQGVAPAGASIAAYRDLGLDLVPGTGHLAAVVPGAFGAWLTLLEQHGTLSFRAVASAAIGYARGGFPLLPTAAATIERMRPLFEEHWPSSAATWLGTGGAPAGGTLLRNPDLAETLERLVAAGEAAGGDRLEQLAAVRRAFYEGFVAEAVDGFVRRPLMDTTGEPHVGFLTAADLAAWRPPVEAPVTLDFAGVTVCKTGPWGQGPVLLQQLAVLESLGVADSAPGSAELVHAVLEAAKLAFADREAWYGDPDFVDVPLDDLLSREYTAGRRALVGASAEPGTRPGTPGGRSPRLPSELVTASGSAAGVGEPTVQGTTPPEDAAARGDTCHLDVVDRWGNVVAVTPSGGWLQSSPTIPGLGFSLPTRAQMFWLEDGLPASLAPGKRPRTTLSPGLLLRDGRPALAFGTPGGDQQDQWVIPFLLNHLLFGMDLQEAIDAPSWHTDDLRSSFYPREREPLGGEAESRLGPAVLADLARRGHRLTTSGEWSLGRVSAAGIRSDGALIAAANPRGRQGYAVGR